MLPMKWEKCLVLRAKRRILECTMAGTNDDTDHYEGAVLEDINHQLAAILEGQAAMAGVPAKLEQLHGRLTGLEGEVKATRAAVTDLSKELRTVSGTVKAIDQRLGRAEVRLGVLEAV